MRASRLGVIQIRLHYLRVPAESGESFRDIPDNGKSTGHPAIFVSTGKKKTVYMHLFAGSNRLIISGKRALSRLEGNIQLHFGRVHPAG